MYTAEFIVDRALSGIRIDSFLAKHLRNYTTWKLSRIVQAGGASINHCLALPVDRVFRGQHVQIRLIEPPDKLLDPEPLEIPVLYQDPWIMVVDKPFGMISHPVGNVQTQTLANGIQYLLDQQTPHKGLIRPGIVHRLDRQTSGVMVVALTHDAHAALAAAFEASRVSKTYIALVEGLVRDDYGTMTWPIGRAPGDRMVLMTCQADARDARPAQTHYQVLQRYAEHTLVMATPRTGRNHQIRVHFAKLGHPLVGDEFYLANGKFKPFYDDLDPDTPREVETGLPIRRHALHAFRLEFSHPISDVWMRCVTSLPDDFASTLVELGSTLNV